MKIDLNVLWKTPNAPLLYQQFKDLVKGAIISGVYQPGERLENEQEFIEQGPLSYPTVSRALRELAREGYIVRKVRVGSFVCDKLPSERKEIRNIAVLYYNLDTPYFKRLKTGLEQECSGQDVNLHYFATGLTLEEEKKVLEQELLSKKIDAVLGYPLGSVELNIRLSKMIDDGIPVVMIGSFYSQFQCDSFSPDYESGSEAASAYLLQQDYTNLIYSCNAPRFPFNIMQTAVDRGIRTSIERSGKRVSYQKITFSCDRDNVYGGKYWEEILRDSSGGSRTGIICDSDANARAITDFLIRQKIRIPEQVAIIGSGDLPIYTVEQAPRLSTMAWPLERMGRAAIRRLFYGNTCKIPERILMDTQLVLRDTTPHS